MLPVLLVYLGPVISVLGFIWLVKPVAFGKIGSRTRGLIALVIGSAIATAGVLFPAPDMRIPSPHNRLDEFAPIYQFREFHSVRVNAPADRVYVAIKAVSADEIPTFETLTWIRRGGRPIAPGILNAPQHQPLLEVATRTSFLLLAEEPNREIVIGSAVLVPAGWIATRRPTPEDFKSVTAPGFALASMNFLVEPANPNSCVVSTETRIYATDAGSVRKFARYWRIIYPGSALIRRMWLRAIKRRAESRDFSALRLSKRLQPSPGTM